MRDPSAPQHGLGILPRCPFVDFLGATVRSRCDLCGKGTTFGKNVSHSKRHTNREFHANIQKTTIMINGYPRKVHVCTRCMRTARKQA